MISVIIPTYKNIQLLIKNLKNNLKFWADCEIIIVNDNPLINLRDKLKHFRSIVFIENKQNLGFGSAVNAGVKIAKNTYIMLLNDDVTLQNNNFKEALGYFKKDRTLFAVSFAQKEKNSKIVGKNRIYWQRGLALHSSAHDLKFGPNGWAEGGTCIIDKKKFIELGGFDSLYSPFYWEDIDLSYRAWKRGYKILFDPKIILTHHHQSTIGKYFTQSQIKTIAFRNQFIFIWKNIHDSNLIFQHFIYLPFNCIYLLMKREFDFLKGFFFAFCDIINILKKRQFENKTTKISDASVINMFKNV